MSIERGELIERLRSVPNTRVDSDTPLVYEAADYLEALQAELQTRYITIGEMAIGHTITIKERNALKARLAA